MTIRFAAQPDALAPRMSRRSVRELHLLAANDEGGEHSTDSMLHAALRHFAEHGLAAAQRARGQAEAALRADDRQGYLWWLDICRTLDRRLAGELQAGVAQSNR